MSSSSCNTLQNTCNTPATHLQHTCNRLQQVATRSRIHKRERGVLHQCPHSLILQHTAKHLQPAATRCNTQKRKGGTSSISSSSRENKMQRFVIPYSGFLNSLMIALLSSSVSPRMTSLGTISDSSCGYSVVTSSYILVLELGINDKSLRPSWSRYLRSLSLLIPREPSCACVCVCV